MVVECLRNLLNNSELGHKVRGPTVQSLEQVVIQNRLRWLGCVLPMVTERLPRCTMFFEPRNG